MHVIYSIFIPAQVNKLGNQASKPIKPKDSPETYQLDLEFAVTKQSERSFEKIRISERFVTIDRTVLMAEFRYQLPSSFSNHHIELKNQLHDQLRADFIKDSEYRGDLIEEYVTLVIDDTKLSPQAYLEKTYYSLARFIRSIDEKITEAQANEILASQVSYNQNYSAIIDWEGAIIFSPMSEAEDDIDLLSIANYQLLRYRLLDDQIGHRLLEIQDLVTKARQTWFSDKRKLQDIINAQVEFMLDFDRIDQSLLLIGDWYSAKLYRLIASKFYITEWRVNIKSKLDSVTRIEELIQNNLTISWDRLLDLAQLSGWLILLVGYFVLFFLELNGS